MDTSKFKLTFLLLIAVLPVSLATWFFGVREVEGVRSTTNRGELIIPVMDITEFDLRDENNVILFESFEVLVEHIDEDNYDPKPWMLIYLGTETCESICDERLYFLRQMHRRLNAESSRVLRYYVNVNENNKPIDEQTEVMFAEAFPEMKLAQSKKSALLNALARTVPEGLDPVSSHYIYVVDPLGNVMLYFTPENTVEEILKDIDKLLDQSSLG